MADEKLRITLVMDGDGQVNASLSGVKKSFSETQASVISLNQGLELLQKAWGWFQAGAGAVIRSTSESERAITMLNVALKNHGDRLGFTSKQLQDYAQQWQDTSTMSDEAIMNMMTQMMAFGKVNDDIFLRGVKAAMDYAEYTGGDAVEAVRRFGVALSEPEKGMQLLRRAGITLDQSTKDNIKTMLEQGRLYDAQNILVTALGKKYEGAAEAARNTFGGALKHLSNMFDELLEVKTGIPGATKAINDLSDQMKDPEFRKFADETLGNIITGLSELIEFTAKSINWLAKLGSALDLIFDSASENEEELILRYGSVEQAQKRLIFLNEKAAELRESYSAGNDPTGITAKTLQVIQDEADSLEMLLGVKREVTQATIEDTESKIKNTKAGKDQIEDTEETSKARESALKKEKAAIDEYNQQMALATSGNELFSGSFDPLQVKLDATKKLLEAVGKGTVRETSVNVDELKQNFFKFSEELNERTMPGIGALRAELQGPFKEALRSINDEWNDRIELLGVEQTQGNLAAQVLENQARAAEQLGIGFGTLTEKARMLQQLYPDLAAKIEQGTTAMDRQSNSAKIVGDSIKEAFTGIALGTRELSDFGDLFKDAFVKAFADTIWEKGKFDDLFNQNIFDLVSNIGSIISRLPGMFGNIFDAILGEKISFDAIFNAVGLGGVANWLGLGGGGSGGGIFGPIGNVAGGLGGAAGLNWLFGGGSTAAGLGPVAANAGIYYPIDVTGANVAPGAAGVLRMDGSPVIAPDVLARIKVLGQVVASLTNVVDAINSGTRGGKAYHATIAALELVPVIGQWVVLFDALDRLGNAIPGKGGQAIRGLTMTPAVGGFFNVITGSRSPGEAMQDTIDAIFGSHLSAMQLSHRYIGSDVLEPLTAFKNIDFDPSEIMAPFEKFPELVKEAGSAMTAFGTTLALAMDTGVKDSDELNYIFNTLLDSLGKAGESGPESIARIAAAMKELGITTDQAAQALTQGYQQGLISLDQYNNAMEGLGQISKVTLDQMVDALRNDLSPEAEAAFQKMTDAGIDAWEAIQTASNEAMVEIVTGLENEFLPSATQTFLMLKSIGIQAAEDVRRAWEGLENLGGETPDTPPEGQWYTHEGHLSFGYFKGGHFYPAAAPELSPEDQKKIRGTAREYQHGGIVGGPIGRRQYAIVHGGETVLPTHSDDGLRRFARAIVAELSGGSQQPMVVNLNVDGRTLGRVSVPLYPRGLPS